jgi:putative Mg2+ transporter-C (MgtC) family protein
MPPDWELIVRLAVAGALGGIIGFERELRDQPAGFRTHILVALGSCLFALVSAYGFEGLLGRHPDVVRFDPGRVASQIVTGIGFLGAGAIIRYGFTVRGLTTAASLWVVAAVGLAVALGEYLTGSVTAAITLVTLWALRRVRPTLTRGLKPDHQEFVLAVEPAMRVEALVQTLADAGGRLDHLRVEEEDGERQVIVVLRLPPSMGPEDAIDLMTRVPGVRNIDWSR